MGVRNSGKLTEPPVGPRKHDFTIVPKNASACVVVFHEVWGLVRHTEDVCKRIGKLGFAAVAPNLYIGYEGFLSPGNIQKAMEAVWDLSLKERRDKVKVARELNKKGVSQKVRGAASTIYDPAFRDRMLEIALTTIDRANTKFDGVATLGFCIGGGLSLKCATKSRHLKSAISYYGAPPANEDASKITIPVLAIHASHDELVNSMVPGFVGAMLEGGKDLTLKTYPQTEHGFFNDTREEVYKKGAANEAWDITKWFLDRTLAGH
jgi:carboxymethylenebutenolidase